jgi:UDP-N-acetylglucosamine 2-epimerase (non-hydrolysing)
MAAMTRRILLILGTRPEAIKLAPLYRALKERRHLDVRLVATGQHREMLADALRVFQIVPDYDLDVMREGQNQAALVSAMLPRLTEILIAWKPNWVVVQGDTSTTFIGALAGYFQKIKVAHVEAGLRTGDKFAPYPEEVYRRMVADLADLHLAPTAQARGNLLAEGILDACIRVTGNTAIDAIRWILSHTPVRVPESLAHLGADLFSRRYVLITCHRRESFGRDIESVMHAIAALANEFSDVPFLFPVHLNPEVQSTARTILGDAVNVHLCDPLDYAAFAHLLNGCYFVMTDSGGIQEEAAELGKPVLVMRRTTERGEGVAAGTALLVGLDPLEIQLQARRLLSEDAFYRRTAVPAKVYGDGSAAQRIAAILDAELTSKGSR